MKRLSRRHIRNAEKGQSLVEMAVGFVVISMIVCGVVDLGRIWYIYVALEDAAGEAALYLSINPYCEDDDSPLPPNLSPTLCRDPNNVAYRARHAVGADVLDWDRAILVVSIPSDEDVVYRNVGETLVVEITYPIDLITPLVPRFTGVNPIFMTARATQTIISQSG